MSQSQENFDTAVHSGEQTLADLRAHSHATSRRIQLRNLPSQRLHSMAWDLEAIGAALRQELYERSEGIPMDLG